MTIQTKIAWAKYPIQLREKIGTEFAALFRLVVQIGKAPRCLRCIFQVRNTMTRKIQLDERVALLAVSDKLEALQVNKHAMSIENGDYPHKPLDADRRSEPKKFDRKTGKEIITSPPYPSFEWREGYVLRALDFEEAQTSTRDTYGQMLGGSPFEWVPASEVDIIEE
jgi:hypothetical protein